MSKKVAIQGEAASFHDVAARLLIGQNIVIVPCETFAEVFVCVLEGRADYGVVAVENSNFGVIHESQNLLEHEAVRQMGDVTMQIEQCLLGLPGASLDTISEIYSHFVALGQCRAYLDAHLPHAARIEHPDTAGSAAAIQTWHDPTKAAIASRAAGQLHGLTVLAASIETDKDNQTRFVSFVKA